MIFVCSLRFNVIVHNLCIINIILWTKKPYQIIYDAFEAEKYQNYKIHLFFKAYIKLIKDTEKNSLWSFVFNDK